MLRVTVGPPNRRRVFVVPDDVPADLPREVRHRLEDAAREQVPFDLAKPEFDLVQPGRIRRGEVQLHARMGGEEGADLLRLMRREIVQDDMDVARPRLRVDDALQERHEVIAGVARCGLADDFADARIQRGIQRQRAVPVVLEAVTLGGPGDNGSTGSSRSSAWMAVFSSKQNTAACCGGCR
jgi:hypothetical protein